MVYISTTLGGTPILIVYTIVAITLRDRFVESFATMMDSDATVFSVSAFILGVRVLGTFTSLNIPSI